MTWWFLRFFDNFFSVSRQNKFSMMYALLALHRSGFYISEVLLTNSAVCLQPVYFALFGFHVRVPHTYSGRRYEYMPVCHMYMAKLNMIAAALEARLVAAGVWFGVHHLHGTPVPSMCSPLLAQCGEHMCNRVTEVCFPSMLGSALQVFIFMTGVFVSSWIGGIFLSIGEWIIKKLPLIKHIYSAAKQVSINNHMLPGGLLSRKCLTYACV